MRRFFPAGACCALLVLQASCAWRSATSQGPEIHSVAELRRLSLDDLRQQYLVRIRGYITVSAPSWNVMILQDEAGNGARLESSDFSVPLDQLVEVTGFAAAGGNTPTIAKARVRWLSSSKPPEPRRVALSQILDRAAQYKQVIVDGVIQSTTVDLNNRISGIMRYDHKVVHVRVVDQFKEDPDYLIDDDVQLTGVVETSYDVFGNPTNPTLWIARATDIVKKNSAPPIASLPVQNIGAFS